MIRRLVSMRRLGLMLCPLLACFILIGGAAAARADVVRVKVGLFITSVNNIDPADGSVALTGYAWFVSPSGTFDPDKDIEWFGRTSSIKDIARTVLPDGNDYAAQEFSIVTDQVFDLRHYPFDRQSLNLRLESVRDKTQIILAPDLTDTRIADFATMQEWNFDGFRFHASDIGYDTKFGYRQTLPQFSRLTFIMDISRKTSAMVIEKFLGFTLAFVISCMIYLFATDDLGIRVGIATGSIFAAVYNRYSLDGKIGFDSSFGLTDQISLIAFSAIGTALLVSIYVRRKRERDGAAIAERFDNRLGAILVPFHLLLAIWAFWNATL